MSKKVLFTEAAPAALGPYSQAIEVNGMVYTSGQLGINVETGEMPEDVQEQAHLVFKNLKAVLATANTDLNRAIKTMVFLSDINDFVAVNEVYAQYFEGSFPARSCVEVARLPKDAKVEIEVIALV